MKPITLILCLAILFSTWPQPLAKAQEPQDEKVALIVIALVVVVVVVGGTVIYSITKFCKKKFPPPSQHASTNSITRKVWDGESAAVLNFDTKVQADQWLSLIPASAGTGRIEIEWATNLTDWIGLPAVTGSLDDFFIIHTNPPQSAFYRLRVNP